MYEKNTGNASPFASLSGRCLLCPVCRAAGVGRCGAFAPRGPKPPPAEACHCGRVPQTSTRRYGAADLRVGILPEEPISSVVYFFLLCFWLDPKAPKDQALRKVAGAATRDRSVTVFVRSRRRCLADTFGATFWCQKVVNLLLAGKTESKVRGYFPKNRSGNFFLLKILFLVLLVRSKWGKCLLLHSAYSYLWLTP